MYAKIVPDKNFGFMKFRKFIAIYRVLKFFRNFVLAIIDLLQHGNPMLDTFFESTHQEEHVDSLHDLVELKVAKILRIEAKCFERR